MQPRFHLFLTLGLLLLALAGCGLPAAGPVVLVTRVPLEAVRAETSPAPVLATAVPGETASFNLVQLGSTSEASAVSAGAADTAADVPPELGGARMLTETMVVTSTVALQVPDGEGLRPLQQTHNILLLGMDQRSLDYVGRTDTIMVLALDVQNSRAALISFPRDIYLPIPGVGYSRINTAYAYGEDRKPGGGLALLTSTIEKNFDVPIHNFVRVDIEGFEEIVDALGGVDITVKCALYDEKFPGYFGVYTLDAGDYHMEGRQALYYARSRKSTNDFDRARRQQQVMVAIRDRMLSGGLVPRIPALFLALKDTVDTDIGPAEIADLARIGANFSSDSLFGMVLRYPLVEDWVTPQGGMVQLPDLPAIADALDNVWNRAPIVQTNSEEALCY